MTRRAHAGAFSGPDLTPPPEKEYNDRTLGLGVPEQSVGIRVTIAPSQEGPVTALTAPRSAELEVDAAFLLFKEGVALPWSAEQALFDLLLLYEVLPSKLIEGRRMVRRDDVQDFLARHPTGTRRDTAVEEEALSLRTAFAEYSRRDPCPVTLALFRDLVRAGVIVGVYSSEAPRAPLVGVRPQTVVEFLATRHRMAERDARQAEEQKRIDELSEKISKLIDLKRSEHNARYER
jgi:hypothetical protein